MSDAVMDQTNDTRRTALGTLLIERGVLDQQGLDDALKAAAESGERLGEVIVRRGLISEEELAQVLAEQWQLRYCERSAITFDSKALRRMSREDATRLEALPIQEGNDGIVVAVAEPTEARLLALRALLGDRIDFVVVAKTAIETGLRSELLAKSWTGEHAPVDGQFDNYGATRRSRKRHRIRPEAVHAVHAVDYDEYGRRSGHRRFRRAGTDDARRPGGGRESPRGGCARPRTRRSTTGVRCDRLEAEVAGLRAELDTSNETIRSMQQTLREFADGLAARAG